MHDERYADTVGEIILTGPVVRIDLVSFSPREKDDKNQPKPVLRERVIMPVEGFVRSFGLMTQLMQQLEKQGVIKCAAGDAPAVPAGAGEAPKSSNFK